MAADIVLDEFMPSRKMKAPRRPLGCPRNWWWSISQREKRYLAGWERRSGGGRYFPLGDNFYA